jgi:hypothetical protein
MLGTSVLLSAMVSLACLPAPPIVRRDAGPDVPLPPLQILAVRARSYDGSSWPLEAVPRRPWIEVEVSRELDEDPPVYLLEGSPDAALLEDLRSSPLRSEHALSVIPCDLHRELGRLELSPRAPLRRGATLTLAVGAWARAGRDTLGEPFTAPITVSLAEGAGAEATASWPPDGASDVGTGLEEGMIRFDGPLRAIEGIRVVGPSGPIPSVLEEVECGFFGLSGTCVAVVLSAPLDPLGQPSLLGRGRGRRDGRTAASVRRSVPHRGGPRPRASHAPADPLRGRRGAHRGGPRPRRDDRGRLPPRDRYQCFVAGAGEARPWWPPRRSACAHEIAFAPRGVVAIDVHALPPDSLLPVTLTLFDTAGRGNDYALEVRTAPALPRVSIAEVRADPLGREPTQEYVELVNQGETPIDLGGFFLADGPDREGDVLSAFVLSPGARVLLVADAFDPEDASDLPPIPVGARLVRVGASLGDGGLGNAGEPLYLRDPLGHRVSSVPSLAPPTEGACLVRRGADPRSPDPSDYQYDLSACSPGTE